jgi:hypothetical protein
MTRVEINSALGLGLERFTEPVEVFDEQGRKLGQFVPYVDPMAGCPYSDEELRAAAAKARANPTQGKTLSQIWKDAGQDALSSAVARGSGGSVARNLGDSGG